MVPQRNQEYKYNETVTFMRAILDYSVIPPPSSRRRGKTRNPVRALPQLPATAGAGRITL